MTDQVELTYRVVSHGYSEYQHGYDSHSVQRHNLEGDLTFIGRVYKQAINTIWAKVPFLLAPLEEIDPVEATPILEHIS